MRRPPLHPLLLAAFPVLFLYARNAAAVPAGRLVVPLLLAVAGTCVVYVLLTAVLHDVARAALATSALVVFFFSYGHVHDIAVRLRGSVYEPHDELAVLATMTIAAAFVVLGVCRVRRPASVTRTMTVGAASLVVLSLVEGGVATARTRPWWHAAEPKPAVQGASRDTPDIYYIVLDRYPAQLTLEHDFAFDNRPFLDQLRARGFFIANDSLSNYPRTGLSLASSLNMDFLDRDREAGWGDVYAKVRDNAVVRFVKERGYAYVHIGSWWEPTHDNPAADLNLVRRSPSELSQALIRSTMLRKLAPVIALDRIDGRREHRAIALDQFDRLVESRELAGPKFVFAHVLLPHEPYVFDVDGSFVPEATEIQRSERESFVRQLQFLNTRVLQIVDATLAGPAEKRPVIVLQADEGPHSTETLPDKTWELLATGDDEALATKFPILSAVHLPDGVPGPLYAGLTPVNTFRLLFSHYFGASLPTLPDRVFVPRDGEHPLDLVEVTRSVHRALGRKLPAASRPRR